MWRRLAVPWPAPVPWENAQEPLTGSEELRPARPSETAAEFAGSAGGPRFNVGPTCCQAGSWLARCPVEGQTRCLCGRRWGPLALERPPRGCGCIPLTQQYCHGSFVDRQHSYTFAPVPCGGPAPPTKTLLDFFSCPTPHFLCRPLGNYSRKWPRGGKAGALWWALMHKTDTSARC